MSENSLTQVLEAVLLAAGRPVTLNQLSELFDENHRPTEEELNAALEELARSCEDRAVELKQVASGWRLQIRQQHADTVSRLWQERPARYSRALLETLALIAYRQPITRGEIEAIRGVAISSSIMRTLQERNWIRVVGHREVPGRPELLGTTKDFLDYFGLDRLENLPTLAELRDFDDLNVQLELPGQGEDEARVAGELSGTVIDSTATDAATSESEADPDEEAADSVDADEDEEGGQSRQSTPTLVAAPPEGTER
jgi:segregation and condensation protein B